MFEIFAPQGEIDSPAAALFKFGKYDNNFLNITYFLHDYIFTTKKNSPPVA
jgi:hypothetical protein